MLIATLYGKTIKGNTLTEIKRKATRISNGFQNVFDCMEVSDEQSGSKATFYRYNKKQPNNSIQFGQWK